jgi:four helix bundle protein
MGKIQIFTDLIVWQEGHKLVIEVYKITKQLPDIEKFGLVSQTQRSAVSITSNIAEGFGRRSEKEKIQFYFIAHGSLTELHNQLLIMRDTSLIKLETVTLLVDKIDTVNRLLLGLIKSISIKP